MLKFLSGIWLGATYPFQAIATFSRHPRLWRYVMIPILINTGVGVGLYLSLLIPGWARVNQLMDQVNQVWIQWIKNLPAGLSFLAVLTVGITWLLKGILILGLLVLVGFLLVQFGILLGSPWYGQLSEQIEQLQLERLETVEGGWLQDLGRTIAFELKKLCVVAFSSLLFLLLNLIPGLGTLVASFGGLVLATLLTSLDLLDPPLERRRLTFRRKFYLVLQGFPATFTLGLMGLVLASIPVLNLVTLPLCIAGGTLLYCDRLHSVVRSSDPAS